jgi:hypothetical protein
VNGRSVIVRASNNSILQGELLSVPNDNTVRWVAALGGAAGLAPDRYRVTLKGSDTTPITAQGIALDGEATALPSGDNVPGGDFNFIVSVG